MQLKSSPTVAVEKKDLSCLASIFSRSHTQKRQSFKSKCLINRRFKRDVEAMGFLLKKPPSETIELEKHRRPPDSQHVLKKKRGKTKAKKVWDAQNPANMSPECHGTQNLPKKTNWRLVPENNLDAKNIPKQDRNIRINRWGITETNLRCIFRLFFAGTKNLIFSLEIVLVWESENDETSSSKSFPSLFFFFKLGVHALSWDRYSLSTSLPFPLKYFGAWKRNLAVSMICKKGWSGL